MIIIKLIAKRVENRSKWSFIYQSKIIDWLFLLKRNYVQFGLSFQFLFLIVCLIVVDGCVYGQLCHAIELIYKIYVQCVFLRGEGKEILIFIPWAFLPSTCFLELCNVMVQGMFRLLMDLLLLSKQDLPDSTWIFWTEPDVVLSLTLSCPSCQAELHPDSLYFH